jgi:hypothetical protein
VIVELVADGLTVLELTAGCTMMTLDVAPATITTVPSAGPSGETGGGVEPAIAPPGGTST